MKALTTLIFIIAMISGTSYGQGYSLYSNDSLDINSKYLKESIRLNLHLPETFHYSSDLVRYPVAIVFDSQHERTYPQIINSFDLLSSETQVPETVIIGVPFNMYNRLYFTSNQKLAGDSLSGIERMELFLFDELFPKLKAEFKANNAVSLIGHSRTAYLVNYLAFKRPNDINLAVALSGFYLEQPLSITSFYSFLSDPTNFSNKFSYYYTAGTTLEESTYLAQYQKLDSLLKGTSLPENVKVQFKENHYANHITNYWVALPLILIDAFSDYNAILDTWLHEKLKNEISGDPVVHFKADLAKASENIGVELNPNLTHIFSLVSYFGYQQQDYNTALGFIDLGLSYFPEFLELYFELIEFNTLLNNTDKADYYKSVLRNKALQSKLLSDQDKKEVLEYLDE